MLKNDKLKQLQFRSQRVNFPNAKSSYKSQRKRLTALQALRNKNSSAQQKDIQFFKKKMFNFIHLIQIKSILRYHFFTNQT